MICGYLTFDADGNDITPMCREADGIDLNDGTGNCIMREECPGYYDGCFKPVSDER